MTNIKHTLLVSGSGCHPASSPTLISIDSVLICVALLHFSAIFNLLFISHLLVLFVIVVTMLLRQQPVLTVCHVWLLLSRNLLRVTCALFRLVILILTLAHLCWLDFNFTVNWRVFGCWILGYFHILFCDIPILMDNGMAGCDFVQRLRNLFGCRNDLRWLGALFRLGLSSLVRSLLGGGSGLLFGWLGNLGFLRLLRGLGFRLSLFSFFGLLSFLGSLGIFFFRSWSLLAHQFKLSIFLLALGLLFGSFFCYLACSCFLSCLLGFVNLHFLFIAFLLNFGFFQERCLSCSVQLVPLLRHSLHN